MGIMTEPPAPLWCTDAPVPPSPGTRFFQVDLAYLACRLYGNAVAVAVVESVVQSMVVALSGEGGDGVGNVVTPID